MDFFTRMFTSMFRTSANRFKNRMTAQVRRQTIGKVQAKAMRGMTNLEQKAYKTTDKVTGLKNDKTYGAPDLTRKDKNAAPVRGAQPAGRGGAAAAGPASRPGTAPAAPGRAMARTHAPGDGQMVRVGKVSANQQESTKMGKGKRNRRQQAMAITCMNCGSNLQPDWDMCPFCGTPVGQIAGPAAPQPMLNGAPIPQDTGEKTVALNLDALNTVSRTVVGWIVAQNGNHRGEDFRIYDGKNILGTAADCDIVITDPFLSAKHCTIRHENGNFQVTDLDSKNGTFVNQKRCTKSDLIDNDTIRLGRTEFKFKSLF